MSLFLRAACAAAIISKGLPAGFTNEKVAVAIRIRRDGTFVKVEVYDQPREVALPDMPRSGSNPNPNTGVDNSTFMFGCPQEFSAGNGGKPRDTRAAAKRMTRYREQLTNVRHPAARAIEKFLDRPDRPMFLAVEATPVTSAPPDLLAALVSSSAATHHGSKKAGALFSRGALTSSASDLAAWLGVAEVARKMHPNPRPWSEHEVVLLPIAATTKLLIEVEGHSEWWLSEPVVQAHSDLREKINAGDDPQYAQCSNCLGEDKLLKRTFDPTSIGSVTSFGPAVAAMYGRSDAYAVPTCVSCADNMTRGIEALLAETNYVRRTNPGTSESKNWYFLWWGVDDKDRPLDAPTWAELDRVFDPDVKDRTPRFPKKGHFAVLVEFDRRLALRFHAPVDGEEIEARLGAWISAGCKTPIYSKSYGPASGMSLALTPRLYLVKDKYVPGSPSTERLLHERLLRHLFGGESVGQVLRSNARRPHPDNYIAAQRTAFLNYLQCLDNNLQEIPMHDTPETNLSDVNCPRAMALTPRLRTAWNFGRLTCVAAAVQRADGKQRPIDVNLEQTFARPARTLGKIQKLIMKKKRGTTQVTFVFGAQPLREAVDEFGDTPNDGIPDNRSDVEWRRVAMAGFTYQKLLDRAKWAEWRANQPPASVEDVDNQDGVS